MRYIISFFIKLLFTIISNDPYRSVAFTQLARHQGQPSTILLTPRNQERTYERTQLFGDNVEIPKVS